MTSLVNDTDRCHYYKQYYHNLLQNIDNYDLKEIIPEIITSIHDNWSEIRKIAYQSLIRLREKLSDEIILILLSNFMNFHENISWQHIHGNLLGISAIVTQIETPSLLEKIQEILLEMLSHSNLPIREITESTLLQLIKRNPQKYPEYFLFLLQQIELKARVDVNEASETYSNFLYSSLSLLSGLSGEALCSKCDLVEPYIAVLQLCLSHQSTTVRIQVTQTIKSLYENACPLYSCESEFHEIANSIDPTLNNCIYRIIDAANNAVSEASDVSHWRMLEGYLLVIEDILLRLSISSIALSLTPTNSPLVTSFLRVIPPFLSNLPSLIFHPVFEITRIVSQILPSLGRVLFLQSLRNPSRTFLPIQSVSPDVQIIVDLEILKTLSVVVETIPLPSFQPLLVNDPFLAALMSLSSSFSAPKWCNIIRRRLTEADRQKLFLQMLSNPIIVTYLTSIFIPLFDQWVTTLVQLSDRIVASFNCQVASKGILSLDSLQMISHLLAFLNWLSAHAPLHSSSIIGSSRNLFQCLIVFLTTFQHHFISAFPSTFVSLSMQFVNCSHSISCLDTITPCSHLAKHSSFDLSSESPELQDDRTTQTIFRKYIWEILTPLLPLLTNLCHLSGRFETTDALLSTNVLDEVVLFIALPLLNFATIDDFKVTLDFVWNSCYHLMHISLQSENDSKLSVFLSGTFADTHFIASLEQALQNSTINERLECLILSLIIMISKLILPEQRRTFSGETHQIYQIITSRINAREKHVNVEESTDDMSEKNQEGGIVDEQDEFSDWDGESVDKDTDPDQSNDLNYSTLCKQFLSEYDVLFVCKS